jgi:WD40 repeat protein
MATVPLGQGRIALATAGDDGTVRLWDAQIRIPLGEPLAGHTDAVFAMTTVPLSDAYARPFADPIGMAWPG